MWVSEFFIIYKKSFWKYDSNSFSPWFQGIRWYWNSWSFQLLRCYYKTREKGGFLRTRQNRSSWSKSCDRQVFSKIIKISDGLGSKLQGFVQNETLKNIKYIFGKKRGIEAPFLGHKSQSNFDVFIFPIYAFVIYFILNFYIPNQKCMSIYYFCIYPDRWRWYYHSKCSNWVRKNCSWKSVSFGRS